MGLFRRFIDAITSASKEYPYTKQWFEKATDSELKEAREPIRKKAIYDGDSVALMWLDIFNNVMIERFNKRYEKEHPGPHEAIHRENGRYLLNDD